MDDDRWDYLEAWSSWVAEVVGEGPDAMATAFFVDSGRALTVADVVPHDGTIGLRFPRFPRSDDILKGRAVKTVSPLALIQCEGGSEELVWRDDAPTGAQWHSFSFVGSGNMPFWVVTGTVARQERDRLLLDYEGGVTRMASLHGAPVVLGGRVAGIIVSGPSQGLLEAVPSGIARQILEP